MLILFKYIVFGVLEVVVDFPVVFVVMFVYLNIKIVGVVNVVFVVLMPEYQDCWCC